MFGSSRSHESREKGSSNKFKEAILSFWIEVEFHKQIADTVKKLSISRRYNMFSILSEERRGRQSVEERKIKRYLR